MRNVKLLSFVLVGAFAVLPISSFADSESLGTSVNNYADDTTTTATIKANILKNATSTDATNISVTTYNDKVQLCGFVDTQDTADKADKIAKDSGKKVVNNVIVKEKKGS